MTGQRRRRISQWAAALLVVLTPLVAAAQPVDFSLDVSPETGTMADRYTATVRVEVAGISGPDRYWDPDFRDFTVVDSQTKFSTSSQIDPKLGQRLRTTEIRRYVLEPKRVGRLRIGPAKIRLDGDEFETRPVRVRVRAASAASPTSSFDDPDPTGGFQGGVPGFRPPDRSRAGESMFLHAVADKRKVVVGEQVTVTWLLYARTEVLKFEPRPPRLDDFWSEVLYEPDAYFTYHEDRVGRRPFVVAVVSKRAVFPTRAGTIEIPPFHAKIATLDTALGRSERVRSQPIELEVEPLPDGAPPGLDPSYVGDYTAEAVVDRRQIDAADALTLTLTIRGTGAIRRTSAPKLEFPGFEFRAPRDYEESVDLSTGIVEGQRTYRYWTTPTEGGQQTIPAIEVPFYNPESERYEVARTVPITIEVHGDPSAIASIGDGSARENVIARDIKLIRSGSSISSRAMLRLHGSMWFWIISLFPPMVFAIVVVTDRLRQRMKKETPRARLRRARGRARQRFRVAEIHLRGNRPPKFFGELSRVIYDHIEERVGKSIQSMTRDEMRSFLDEKGFNESTIKQIIDSLETFDFARFAPSAAGPDEMRSALRRTKELLRRIERTRLREDDLEDAA